MKILFLTENFPLAPLPLFQIRRSQEHLPDYSQAETQTLAMPKKILQRVLEQHSQKESGEYFLQSGLARD